ncbi:MAG: EcsC family protein [Lacipirellulaceae bacterium]
MTEELQQIDALQSQDWQLLHDAVRYLESSSWADKLASTLGVPVETLMGRLPSPLRKRLEGTIEGVLSRAYDIALATHGTGGDDSTSNVGHKLLALSLGAAGGFFGTAALLVEIPATTVVMLRSIADIAASRGEDLSTEEARMACLEVFALGSGQADEERIAEESMFRSSYFATRAMLAQQVTIAVRSLAAGGSLETSSLLAKLIARIAPRFGVVVSQKAAAQAVPILGAIGGGTVNTLFIDHYQKTAEAHFSVRKLQRKYGKIVIQQAYEHIATAIERN